MPLGDDASASSLNGTLHVGERPTEVSAVPDLELVNSARATSRAVDGEGRRMRGIRDVPEHESARDRQVEARAAGLESRDRDVPLLAAQHQPDLSEGLPRLREYAHVARSLGDDVGRVVLRRELDLTQRREIPLSRFVPMTWTSCWIERLLKSWNVRSIARRTCSARNVTSWHPSRRGRSAYRQCTSIRIVSGRSVELRQARVLVTRELRE